MESGKYKYDLVEIIWDDAQTDDGWDKIPDKLEEQLAMTVGFIVRSTKKHVLVVHTIDGENTNGRMQIPKGMIKKMTVLKEKGL